ncbi:MAG: GNAT family N-acetyltransferase [Mesorhizobium sp.]
MLGLSFLGRDRLRLPGCRVTLRIPTTSDYEEWSSLRRRSRDFLEKWEPRWASDELDRAAWRLRVRRYRDEYSRGTGVPFLIELNDTGSIVGGISVGNIRRGVAQSGQIGYWMGEPYAGKGLMGEAVGVLSRYCFESLRLHRIEAACIPDNLRSIRVLEKAGFTREGLLRSYLRINGDWQDHYLYALLAGEYHEQGSRGAAVES